MALLPRFFARDFSLPAFTPAPLDFYSPDSHDPDELLLDRVVVALDRQGDVVALAPPLPTAGELRDSIERHLSATGRRARQDDPPDPAEELRTALADLRRSLA